MILRSFETLINPLRRVPLLRRRRHIRGKDSVDDRDEWSELRPMHRRLAHIPRRRRKLAHLIHALPAQAENTRCCPPASPFYKHELSDGGISLHGMHLPLPHDDSPKGQLSCWRPFAAPRRSKRRRFRGLLFHRRAHWPKFQFLAATTFPSALKAQAAHRDRTQRARLGRTADPLVYFIHLRTSAASRSRSGNRCRPRPLVGVLRSRLQRSKTPVIKFVTSRSTFFAVATILSAVGG